MHTPIFPRALLWMVCTFLFFLGTGHSVSAVTCSITTDTVIDQAGVDAGLGLGGGACTDIEINGNVSTTWVGSINLNGAGGGTVTVISNNTMTMGTSSEMILDDSDTFLVQANATATHRAGDPNGLKIRAGTISISGALDVTAKGCPGGGFGEQGWGPLLSTGECTSGATGGTTGWAAGASHGGLGAFAGVGTVGIMYGTSTAPTFLGSGAGGGCCSSWGDGGAGGGGGGRIQITATGALTVNGLILANGWRGGDGVAAGGGAGGSIYIIAGSLTGSGSISASGALGGNSETGPGGGGGRIAIYYDSSSFPTGSINAQGAATSVTSTAAGTVYLLDRATDDGSGNVIVKDGFDFPAEFDGSRTTFTAASTTALRCIIGNPIALSATTVNLSATTWSCSTALAYVHVTGTGALYATGTVWTLTNVTDFSMGGTTEFALATSTWTVSKAGSTLRLATPSTFALSGVTINGPVDAGQASGEGGRLHLTDNLALSLRNSSALRASVVSSTLASLSIDTSSSIDASDRGCVGGVFGGSGYGPDEATNICGLGVTGSGGVGAGGSHGGLGGDSVQPAGSLYGVSTFPILYGSGGGGGCCVGGDGGGNGGGRISLLVTGALTLNGTLASDGGQGDASAWGGGGGSGGSVYVYASSLVGSGTIRADGGAGGGNGARGGGGRVAFIASGGSFFTLGTSSTSPGVGVPGTATTGTIYSLLLNQSPDTPSSLGQTALTNGSTTGTNNPIFTFTLSDPDVDTVQYRIQIDDSSNFASPVVDYTSALAAEGARTFQVGQAAGSGAYTVGSVSQTLSNGSFYWRVKTIDAAAAESSYTTANSGAVAFSVDATPRYLRFADSQAYGLESITATSIRILLDTSHFETVSVNYAVTENTATGSGTDFTLSSGTVTIPSGNTTGTISLSITDDTSLESEEYLVITLSSPQYATIGSNTSTSYIIIDNDQGGSSSGGSTTGGGGTSAGSGSGAGALTSPSSFSFVPPLSSQLPVSSAPLFSEPDSSGNNSPQTPPASESSEEQPSSPEATSLIQILNPRDPVRVAEVLNGGERDLSREASARSLLSQDTRSLRTPLSPELQTDLSIFLTYGTSPLTAHLGEGERRAIIRDWLDTSALTNLSSPDITRDFERMTRGALPTHRNLSRERAQLPRVQATFRTIYGHNPDFQNPEENLAWNTLMYRIRFDRDLTLEREGITEFRRLFGRAPQDPFQWSVVRVLGYVR